MIYAKAFGAILIIACTTLFGADMVRANKRLVNDRYICHMFFEKLANKISEEGCSIVAGIRDCSIDMEFSVKFAVVCLCDFMESADITTVEDAWMQCTKQKQFKLLNKNDADILHTFAAGISSTNMLSCVEAAQNAAEMYKKEYTELMNKLKTDSKLLMYTSVFAGVFTVILLI